MKLTASDGRANDSFGNAVALDGNIALVGAVRDHTANGRGSGSVYVFARSGDSWTELTKLAPSDANAGDLFGDEIVMGAGVALISASGDSNPNGERAGSTYVFARNDGSWIETDKITASDGDEGANFGSTVALDGNTAVIAGDYLSDSDGRAYIYDLGLE